MLGMGNLCLGDCKGMIIVIRRTPHPILQIAVRGWRNGHWRSRAMYLDNYNYFKCCLFAILVSNMSSLRAYALKHV